MQTTDLGADECLDPSLMSAFEDNPFPQTQWHCPEADAGPPSPFDMSTIDPDLLALYPEQNGGVELPAASPPVIPVDVEAHNLSLSPPLQEEPSAIAMPTEDTASDTHNQPPPAKRVHFAPLPPPYSPEPEPQLSPRAERRATRAQTRQRPPCHRVSKTAPRKHSAIGIAKRTISDGTLVPPSGPCKRCEWEEEECLIKYAGAACNVCRRRGRKCELVDESVKYNGQRAKDLMRADGSGSGS